LMSIGAILHQARVPPHDGVFERYLQVNLHTKTPYLRQICLYAILLKKTCMAYNHL